MKKLIFAMILGMATFGNALVAGSGYKIGSENVKAYDSDIYSFRFVGGYQAGAYLSGDGDTDLDLYIYDQNGNQVCSSTSSGDDEYCIWNPIWTGPFKVVVKNRGGISNNYVLKVN